MWIEIETIKQRLAGPEYNAVTSAALNTAQDGETLVNAETLRVVKLVRGYVGKRNILGTGDTIPDELENAALALIVVNILTRLPGLKSLLTKERTEAAKDAMRILRDVSAGGMVIVPPETAASSDAQPGASIISTVQAAPKRYTRENLGNLF